MRTLDQWLNEYAVSHTHPFNTTIHKICVPTITFSLLGLLWSIPTPEAFPLGVNYATLFFAFALAFYTRLSLFYTVFMALQCGVMLYLCHLLAAQGILLVSSAVIFVVSWLFQFWGHKVEGAKPSFFEDLQFLLIGPLWVSKWYLNKVGIKA
jgi:uncharacterized membrane protein YGL010W